MLKQATLKSTTSQQSAAKALIAGLEIRLRRATTDLTDIQHELSRAAIHAVGESTALDAIKKLENSGELGDLKAATDQMRQFIWFYRRAINPETATKGRTIRADRLATLLDIPGLWDDDEGEEAALSAGPNKSSQYGEADFLDRVTHAADSALRQYLTTGKAQKPN